MDSNYLHLLFFKDGDGLIEMAVAYADRVVRTFRWQMTSDTPQPGSSPVPGRLYLVDKWQLAGQVRRVCVCVFMSVCVSVYECVCMCVCVWVHVCMYVSVYVCMCECGGLVWVCICLGCQVVDLWS
jgi:hypothetical protein